MGAYHAILIIILNIKANSLAEVRFLGGLRFILMKVIA